MPRWRKRIWVNFLSFACLCSNLSIRKDTLHHPVPESVVGHTASWGWGRTDHSNLSFEENYCVWEVVGSFFTCMGNIFRLRSRVLVNFLGYACLCSSLTMEKDTSHRTEPEEGVAAS